MTTELYAHNLKENGEMMVVSALELLLDKDHSTQMTWADLGPMIQFYIPVIIAVHEFDSFVRIF